MPVTSPPAAPVDGLAPTRHLSRRRVLQLTAASVLGISLGACSWTGDGDKATEDEPTDFWLVIADAARKEHPELTRRAAEAELATIGGRDQLRHPSDARRRAVKQRIGDDFAAGRTMLVSGWLLARTEVAAAIVATGPTP